VTGEGVTLRPMRWWDVPAALEVEGALFPDAWSEAAFWSELAGVPDTRWYVVAEHAGLLVGYAGLFATRHLADVQTVAVAPTHQGQGLGGVLLRALLEEVARRGVGEVLLEVRADNEAGQRLYVAHGFERIGVRRGYYQPGGVDAVVMRRRSGRASGHALGSAG
jgi:[ribosomal protein S18]-alanine N-acetyltransferase